MNKILNPYSGDAKGWRCIGNVWINIGDVGKRTLQPITLCALPCGHPAASFSTKDMTMLIEYISPDYTAILAIVVAVGCSWRFAG